MKKKVFIFLVLVLGMNSSFAQGIWKSYTVEDGLPHGHVHRINQDHEGNMWFATRKGLCKLDTNDVLTHYPIFYNIEQNDCAVADIDIDHLNHKWMVVVGRFDGVVDQFVVEYDDSAFTFYDPAEGELPIQDPMCTGIDSIGAIWAGMRDNYAWQYDGDKWHPFYVWGTRMYDSILDIITDRHGKLFFVHGAGVSTLEGYIWPGVDTWIEMRRAAFDRQNRMWCASRSNGLRMLNFETNEWTIYTPPVLLADGCQCVAIDSLNSVWIGFYNGIQRFDGKNWTTFTTEDGLVQNEVWDIYIDKVGDIWIGTDEGVSVFRDTTSVTKISPPNSRPCPKEFQLFPNFPNPFNSTTRIRYEISNVEQVKLYIFNSTAQLVTTLVNEVQQPGIYEITWNAKDIFGKEVSSGVYFGVLQVGAERVSQKLVYIG